ncbi:hypothetical protein EXIGLDRAFT_834258 [Exidia glandulosa HHB12029]|uniref:Uncharacterized protein n=1 Tax=Exidia glandulosa HHB12029 TaxID=1314781 RepID=A0A165JZ50_EXIGL|nr:hypothetical protein EXIGLDRAFT_834258 [Exidia glandulosa HHB12029]
MPPPRRSTLPAAATTLETAAAALKVAREATETVPIAGQILGSAAHIFELAEKIEKKRQAMYDLVTTSASYAQQIDLAVAGRVLEVSMERRLERLYTVFAKIEALLQMETAPKRAILRVLRQVFVLPVQAEVLAAELENEMKLFQALSLIDTRLAVADTARIMEEDVQYDGDKSSSTRRTHAHGSTTTAPATRDNNKTTSTRSTPPKNDVTSALDAEAARLAARKADPRWIVIERTRFAHADQAVRERLVELGDRYFLNFARCSDAVHDVAQMLPSFNVMKGERHLVKRLLDDLQRIALWLQPGLDELNIAWPAFFARVPASPSVSVATQTPVPKPAAAPVAPAVPATSTAPSTVAVPASSSVAAAPATPAVSTVPAATSLADTRPPPEPAARPPAAAAPVSYASVTSTRPASISAPTPRTSPAIPQSSCRSPSMRLIVRYPTSDVLQNSLRPHPATLTSALNKALDADYVSAISYSHRGQLILHTHAPYDAQQLAQHSDKIQHVLRSVHALATDMTPTLETGETWSKVVVHNVPLPICSGASDVLNLDALLADVCASNGLHTAAIRVARPLCPRNTLEHRFRASTSSSPQFVPILLGFSDSDAASQLLRNGLVWQYAHCRVSRYRPRRTDSAAVRREMLPTPRATPEK